MASTGLLWVFIISGASYWIGRKWTCLFIAGTSLIGFIILYTSSTVLQIVISQIIQGPLAAGQVTIGFLVPSEYTSPKYRGIFLNVQAATMFWGVWVANAIGAFMHWKNIALLGIICGIYSFTNVLFWKESPYWLAVKGRLRECAVAHRWLKGTTEESEKELEGFIDFATDVKMKTSHSSTSFIRGHVRIFFTDIILPEVYKPFLLSLLSASFFHISGKVVCTVYSIKIIKKITSSESTAYIGMLILDGATVIGLYCGCFLSKRLKRRTLLFSTCPVAILFLYSTAFYLFLIKFTVIPENKYVSLTLLTLFSLAVSVGPMILSVTLLCELIPLKSRSVCICVLSFLCKILMSTILKITPYLFKVIDFCGTFLLFGVSCSILIFVAYKYLPETKDKTIVEISEYFKGTRKDPKEAKELMLVQTRTNNDRN